MIIITLLTHWLKYKALKVTIPVANLPLASAACTKQASPKILSIEISTLLYSFYYN